MSKTPYSYSFPVRCPICSGVAWLRASIEADGKVTTWVESACHHLGVIRGNEQ